MGGVCSGVTTASAVVGEQTEMAAANRRKNKTGMATATSVGGEVGTLREMLRMSRMSHGTEAKKSAGVSGLRGKIMDCASQRLRRSQPVVF